MKKNSIIFFLLFSFLNANAFGESSPPCAAPADSLNPLGQIFTNFLTGLADLTKVESCDKEYIFADIKDAKFNSAHSKDRCDQVAICKNKNIDKETSEDASKILNENLPKAVLLGVLDEELKKNLDYNIKLKKFEDKTKIAVCPVEKIEASKDCRKDIRNALSSASGSLIGYPNLDKQPDLNETTEKYFNTAFLSYKHPNMHLNTRKEVKDEKNKLLSECSNKITFAKICKLRDERLKEITLCESNPQSQGCLNQEQNALASLLNSQKNNKDVYLEIENQLCSSTRIVKEKLNSLVLASSLGPLSSKSKDFSLGDKVGAPVNSSSSPDAQGVVKVGPSELPLQNISAVQQQEEIISVDSEQESSFLESYPNSMPGSFNPISSNVNNSSYSSSTSRYNYLNEEELTNNNPDKLAANSDTSSLEKNKQQEINGLTGQINSLKEKLEEMNKVVEELNVKKELAASVQEKAEKEALEKEKEKEILDLKNKIAALETEKQRAQIIAKANEEYRAKVEVANNASIQEATVFANRSKISNFKDEVPKDIRKDQFNSTQASENYSGGSSNIVLHSNTFGTQAAPESNVVYMTAVELQKYPYHLSDKASESEIENMLLKNKGAAIIVGNEEEIIPELVKGVVQLDEYGRIKYKRIKISLVKNDNEKKQNVAREISSIADLKKEDQKKRDLIRYQEMKALLKKATD
jgi:hypothetical protein